MESGGKRVTIIALVSLLFVVLAGLATYVLESKTPNSAVSITIVYGLLLSVGGVMVTLSLESFFQIRSLREPHPVDIVRTNEGLVAQYERIRSTRGAILINAIWSSGRYMDVGEYFRREFAALRKNQDLTILRLINPKAVGKPALEEYWREYAKFVSDDPRAAERYTHCETDVEEFECFIGVHQPGKVRECKCLFVYNNIQAGVLPLGLYIDSQSTPESKEAAQAVESWFIVLNKLARPLTQETEPEAVAGAAKA
jgi:hypothetical protein